MPPSTKRAFYPDPIVAEALEGVRPKKLSERVNDLIRKGLEREREERVRLEYARVDRELASDPRSDDEARPGSKPLKWLAAEPLFDSDESDEDLF